MVDVTDPNCPVCKRPGRRRLVDADLADGLTPGAIAASMRDGGWALTALDVSGHAIHAAPGKVRSAASRKRDAALTVRERLIDEVERRIAKAEEVATRETAACELSHFYPDEKRMHPVRVHDPAEYFDVLDKDVQAAFGTIIKAQALHEKKEARESKSFIGLFKLMLGGADGAGMLAPEALRLSDGETIDGEFDEIDGSTEA